MSQTNLKESGEFVRNDVRLKTFPVAVKFLKDKKDFPEKTCQPSTTLGKRIALCQGVTMARNYGWTVGMGREDLICVPAAIVFGFSDSPAPPAALTRLFCDIKFSADATRAEREVASMSRFENGEISAVLFTPLAKASFEPDTILFYGNPAQMMRFAQAWSYVRGERVSGHFGGKVECDEYLIAPYKTGAARIVIPGNGERIFASTQDDEMAFAIPGNALEAVVLGLKEAGKAIGIRYPVTPYQNFQPDFPKAHKELGKEIGVL